MVNHKLILWLLLTFIGSISAADLPGLDFLSAGFDALKMINLNEEPSASDKHRFRLFDLSDGLGKSFSISADGIEHTYQTSSYVQATTINMKTKVAIESVCKTFQQFRREYFQSYSFSIGIPIPLGGATLNIGLKYHNTLRTGYEKITQTEGAVGTSSDWWGLYSVSLAPTYLIKFDPMFKAALDKLVEEPKTSKDQSYYNRLIEAFGTHYASSVIVGGLGNLYTYLSRSLTSEASTSSIEESVSVSFNLAMGGGVGEVGADGLFRWGAEVSTLSKEFRENSLMQTKFIPAVIVSPGEERNQWNIWKRETISNPSVVNRTLSPLVDLLLDYPDKVQAHLQSTIDYYLLNGVLPTLEQLSAGKTARSLLIPANLQSLKEIPGLDVVGCGFDISAIENRKCLFDISTNINQSSTWTDVYNNDKTYRIPPNFFLVEKRNVNALSESKFFNTIQEYFQKSIYSIQEDDDGFLGFGASSYRKDIKEMYRQFYEYNYQMAWTRREILMYTLSINTFPTPNFNDITKLAINGLPTNFDSSSPSNINVWKAFFKAYGTHVVVSSDMGGLLWAEDYFEKCLVTKTSETWVREQLRRSYWFFESNRYVEGHTTSVDKTYLQYRSATSKLIGGIDDRPGQASTIEPFYINSWISTVKNYPQSINYRVMPIYQLLPKGDKKEAMKMATNYVRKKAVEDINIIIKRMQTHPNPPPLPKIDCSPTSGLKKRSVSSSTFDLTMARKSLCPVVGFRGTFCPGDPTWRINFSNLTTDLKSETVLSRRNLPAGVGMSFDIATGDILLPALEFTYPTSPPSTSLWTDERSMRTFIIPDEIILEPINDGSMDVNISIYSNADELTNEWLNIGTNGAWSTSFISNIKNISEVDSLYFSDDQGTAIGQNYSKLYSLRVKQAANPQSLPLNSYARAAINALTDAYDADLYNEFFNAWGTHVAVETTIGGITEKQILFQKCLNLDVVRSNIQAEITSKRPCISENYHKWRKSYSDARIGGDPHLIQDTVEWFHTLSYAPTIISVKSYIPWSDIVSNPSVKKNLIDALAVRVDKKNENRQEQINKVVERRKLIEVPADLIVWRVTEAGNSSSSIVSYPESHVPVLLQNIYKCGSGRTQEDILGSPCTLNRRMTACSLQSNSLYDRITSTPISYERNLVTGYMRVIALRQYATGGGAVPFKNYDLVGNWVGRGCSEIVNDNCGLLEKESVHRVQLCTRCRALCANRINNDLNNHCTCPSSIENNCPSYPQAGPYRPYCDNR